MGHNTKENKYYVYIVGKQVPYIIRAESEMQIRAEWDYSTGDVISFIDTELEPKLKDIDGYGTEDSVLNH